MQANIISIGTELLTGACVDTNSAWLSEALGRLGVVVLQHVSVRDDAAQICDAIADSANRCDLVIVTGGLGPTPDDLTRAALAAAMATELVTDPTCLNAVCDYFKRMNRPMPESNAVQALVPAGATPLPNDWGTAPGLRVNLHGATVFCLPGVPREMREMFERYVAPHVTKALPDAGLAVRVVHTFGAGESTVAQQIADLMVPGRNPAVGTTASGAVISVRIVARDEPSSAAALLADRDVKHVRDVLGELVYGENDDTLWSVVAKSLIRNRATLATAESCTGGLLAKLLTDVPGSSAYFLGGYVTYSNNEKTKTLGIDPNLIETQGAVSEPVAAAMAESARKKSGADYALSITGIAGPTGGTKDKPVGLVYIGLADPTCTQVRQHRFSDHLSRTDIRERAAKTALNTLRHALM